MCISVESFSRLATQNRSCRLRYAAIWLLAVGLFASLDGCGKREHAGQPREATHSQHEVVVCLRDESTIFNPLAPNFSEIGRFLSGSLLRADSDGNWHPQCASTIERAGNELVITLNPNWKFSNGEPISAADMVASLRAHADPAMRTSAATILAANGFREVEEVATNQVRVRFDRVWIPAFTYIAQLSIWPSDLIERIAADPKQFEVLPMNLVGAGTHRVKEYVPHESALLEPVASGPMIRIAVISDKDAAMSMFEQGELDLVYVEPRRQARFQQVSGARVLKYPYPEVVTAAFNFEPTTLTGQHESLREALMRTVDPELIRRLVAAESSVAARGRIFCGANDGDNAPDIASKMPTYDPEAANALLDRDLPIVNGARVGADEMPVTLTVLTYDSTEYPIVAERLAADWSRLLKITVRSRVLRPVQFHDVLYRRNSELGPADWNVVIDEWPYRLTDFEPSRAGSVIETAIPGLGKVTGRNVVGLRNLEISQIALEADQAVDAQVRRELFWKFHHLLMRERAVIPLYVAIDGWAVSKRVEGITDDEANVELKIFRWADKLDVAEISVQ